MASSSLDKSSDGDQKKIDGVDEALASLSEVSGFLAAALVDSENGLSLGTLSGNNDFDVEAAAANNTDVVQVKMRVVRKLELDDAIEDILITLDNQYHLIRPLAERPAVFFYMALDRGKSNLAMARMSLSDVTRAVTL